MVVTYHQLNPVRISLLLSRVGCFLDTMDRF